MRTASGSRELQEVGNGAGAANSQLLRRADLILKSGSPAESKELLKIILDSDPLHVGALETRAKAQWNLGEHEGVLTTVSRLLQINPYEPGYHLLRGNSLRQLGRYGEALRSFVRAGDSQGAAEAVEELSALQLSFLRRLLELDPVFRARYAQNPEEACAVKGLEFGSETKIRHWVMANEYSTARMMQRPS
jgi:tetratricopeptide (TPR) repeat protein